MASLAFFDVDHTILRVNSGTEWMRFQYRRGQIGRVALGRAIIWSLLYRMAVLDMERLAGKLAAGERGGSEPEMRALCDQWWQDEIRAQVTPGALAAIDAHRARGDTLALLTGGSQFLAEPMARDLGFHAALCSRLEHADGVFTGTFTSPLCYAGGKVHWAEGYARAQGQSLRDATFYTDSYTDLPMLEAVGRPIVVNPDFRLERTARRRGWPIERWT